MYITYDAITPKLQEFTKVAAFKNIILNNWPTKVENNINTFDRLRLWSRSYGVDKSPEHLRIYKTIGIKVQDLEKQNYKGLNAVYLQIIAPTIVINDKITESNLRTFIEQYDPMELNPLWIDDGNNTDPDTRGNSKYRYVTHISNITYDPNQGNGLVYTPDGHDPLPNSAYTSNADIINYVSNNAYGTANVTANYNGYWDGHTNSREFNTFLPTISYHPEDTNLLTCLALLDVNELIFTREFKVLTVTVDTQVLDPMDGWLSTNERINNGVTKYIKTAIVELKFTRKTFTNSSEEIAFLNSVLTKMQSLATAYSGDGDIYGDGAQYNPYQVLYLKAAEAKGVTRQLAMIVTNLSEELDTDLFYIRATSDCTYTTYIKYDTMLSLPAKEFKRLFPLCITTTYDTRRASLLEKAITGLVFISALLVAVIFPPAAELAFAVAAMYTATVIAIYAVVVALVAYAVAATGNEMFAAQLLRVSMMISKLSQAVGILGAVQGIGANTVTEKVEEIVVEEIVMDVVVEESVMDVVVEESVMDVAEESVMDVAEESVMDVAGNAINKAVDYVKETITNFINDFMKSSVKNQLKTVFNAINYLLKGLDMYADYKYKKDMKDKQSVLDMQESELALYTPADIDLSFQQYQSSTISQFETTDFIDVYYDYAKDKQVSMSTYKLYL